MVYYNRTHDSVAMTLSTLEGADMESLHKVFKRPFVPIKLHNFYGVMVDQSKNLQMPNYNQGYSCNRNINLFDSYNLSLVLFVWIYKTESPFRLTYT